MKTFVFFLLTTLGLQAATIPRKADDDLTLVLAQTRKAQVRSVTYELWFDLQPKALGYKGKLVMKLVLNHLNSAVSVDAKIDKIESLKVNGEILKKYPTRLGSFDLPQNKLLQENTVEIEFTNKYSAESSGFMRVTDPEDQSEYMYTDFEPYQAHKLFPCLDQPDLKATYTLHLTAPSVWKVIHNEAPVSTEDLGGRTLTHFKTTPPLSTYLFFMGAGPFVEWKDSFEKIPLQIYARKSLEKYIDADRLFETTKKGLKFFNQYFGYPYPFSKYGQIFIPDFAWGGMENPGAVTLNERNIFRGPVSATKMEDRDNLLLHEMAHMWFGDLVTMEWWNDLWLNESFASYLATIAQERGMNSKAIWMDFYHSKTWGYWQDQLVTTHPIETPVPDVRTARGNFDGITYAKGAAALKQLHFFVGEEGFREGLRTYFKTYAWKNTQRKDFIGAIAAASKVDLSDWTQKWLQTAGPNKVEVKFTCEKDKIKTFEVEQKASVSKTLSPHRARFALYKFIDEELIPIRTHEVQYTTALTTVDDLIGRACPDFVMTNADDMDYALYSLDPKSLGFAKTALSTLPDPLSRLMLWYILGEMVRNEELSPKEYLQLATTALKVEQDDMLLGLLLGRHSMLRDQYLLYLDKGTRAELAPGLEEVLWARIETSKPTSSLQMNFFDFLVSLGQSQAFQAKIHEMLTKNTPPKGITLDQDRRWALIQALGRNGHTKAQKLALDEEKKDPSTSGKRMALVTRASLPDKKIKAQFWKKFKKDHALSYSNFKEAAAVFTSANHEELMKPYVQDFFDLLVKKDWKKHDDVVDIFFEKLFPVEICDKETVQMSERTLKRAKNLSNLAERSWLEAHDELSRCVRVRSHIKNEVSL